MHLGHADRRRHRLETRTVDMPGLKPLDWDAVVGRGYRPWDCPRLVIDTAGRNLGPCVEEILARL